MRKVLWLIAAIAATVCVFALAAKQDARLPAHKDEIVVKVPSTGDRVLDNRIAFARILGIVRHFHPSDAASKADWESVARNGMAAVSSARNASELATAITTSLQHLGPTIDIHPTGGVRKIYKPLPDATEVVWWEHYGGPPPNGQHVIYKSERKRAKMNAGIIPPTAVDPNKPWRADLPGGVSAVIPVALFADDRGTLPKSNAKATVKATDETLYTRLGTVALAWNHFKHFYPYFEEVKVDWDAVLVEALQRAAADKTSDEFSKTLSWMLAQLKDGHGGVYRVNNSRMHVPPLSLALLEGKVVVTAAVEGAGPFKMGDIITAIDGRPVQHTIDQWMPLTSGGTEGQRRYILANIHLLGGAPGSEVDLEGEHADGSKVSAKLKRSRVGYEQLENRPKSLAEVKPGIYYIDVNAVQDAELKAATEKLANAKGVIYDFRGYPSGLSPATLFANIIKEPVVSAHWKVAVVRLPEQQGIAYSESRWPPLQPQEPRFKGRVVYLIDGRAVSYAESCMGIVEHYKLGEIVGETTAGTNGNVNNVILPGGYVMGYTGMRVIKHDGTPHHGVGIKPTVPVSRTIKGIQAGRDEQLEKAIEVAGG